MRGKTRTHLMEICFNSRGRFMKITEIVTKRKPLVLVVPEGVKGNGWETLRKTISSVQDLSDQAVRASKEMLKSLRRGWLELRGLAFDLWDEVQLRYICRNEGRLKNAEGLRATAKDNECHNWRPRHRSRARSSDSNSVSKAEKGRGGSPVHETEAGSSNGGPTVPLSSKLQRLGSFAKRRKVRSYLPRLKVSTSVPKRNLDGGGSSEANRAILRGRSVSNKGILSPISKTPKISPGDRGRRISRCNLVNKVCLLSQLLSSFSEQGLPLVGAFHPNFFPTPLFLCSSFLMSVFFYSVGVKLYLSVWSLFEFSCYELSRCVGMSCSEDVAFPLETSNRNFKDCHFLRESLSNPEELCVSDKASSPKPEPPTLPLEGFQVEGLTLGSGQGNKEINLGQEVCEQCLERHKHGWAALPACGASGGL
ncbi:hypothetical protein CK203_075657 [Vitis vinifera]|uniref:Uncharacterized protein n=1 Tax=Vitis vinifera TaxID=29760 RepID=A0A438EGI3_VITVI|nr:hypothetical protein CK203_075657 [Vitis vinifera]